MGAGIDWRVSQPPRRAKTDNIPSEALSTKKPAKMLAGFFGPI
jgi:hypothetical protein